MIMSNIPMTMGLVSSDPKYQEYQVNWGKTEYFTPFKAENLDHLRYQLRWNESTKRYGASVYKAGRNGKLVYIGYMAEHMSGRMLWHPAKGGYQDVRSDGTVSRNYGRN